MKEGRNGTLDFIVEQNRQYLSPVLALRSSASQASEIGKTLHGLIMTKEQMQMVLVRTVLYISVRLTCSYQVKEQGISFNNNFKLGRHASDDGASDDCLMCLQ